MTNSVWFFILGYILVAAILAMLAEINSNIKELIRKKEKLYVNEEIVKAELDKVFKNEIERNDALYQKDLIAIRNYHKSFGRIKWPFYK
jgi:hypothetical protein